MLVHQYERASLVEAFKFLESKKNVVEDEHGNVSCRVEGGFIIKPSGMSYSKIEERHVAAVACSSTGYVVVGEKKPSVDTDQHYEIYRRNPDISSICHTHSPYATAFAIAGMGMNVACTEHADYFGHPIRCLPYAPLDQWGKIELDRTSVFEQAVLLGKHGVLICCTDENPLAAAKLAVALEAIAKKYHLVMGRCANLSSLPDGETSLWHSRYDTSYGQ